MVHGVFKLFRPLPWWSDAVLTGFLAPEPTVALRTRLQEMKAAKGGKGATVPQKKAREAQRRGLVQPPSLRASSLRKRGMHSVPLRVNE